LPRKRNLVGPPHLHLRSGDSPDLGLEVELCPFRPPKLAGPHEDVWREAQRNSYVRLPFVGLDCPQQSAELAWLHDRRAMLDLGGDERAVQI